MESVVLFAAFLPPAEFRAFDPPAAQVLPAGPTYADVYARVLNGERVTWEGAPPGMSLGVYECWMQNGSPVMRLVPPVVAALPAAPDCPPGQP